MSVAVYMNLTAKEMNKAVFKRTVLCPDAFEYDAFVRIMRSIFGNDNVIEFLIV